MKIGVVCRTGDAEELAQRLGLSILPEFESPGVIYFFNPRDKWASLDGEVDGEHILRDLEQIGKQGVMFVACVCASPLELFGAGQGDDDRQLVVAYKSKVKTAPCGSGWQPIVSMREDGSIRSADRTAASEALSLLNRIQEQG